MTHSHADHTHGIDDLRPLVIAMRKRIDIHMDEATSRVVRQAFGYIFEAPPGSLYPALLNEERLTSGRLARIEGPGGPIEALPFTLDHGDISALGFRFGALAYTPDLKAIPPESEQFLESLDTWIIGGLRYKPHPTHFSVGEALAWVARMRPRRAVITNLHTDLDYEALKARLPANVTPAYDGLRIENF
jgi:phosphoribosyl 1,2-cyclic phosphate phosphodiesterase